MAYVRRHWLASALYGLIITLGLAVFLTPMFFSENATAEAQAQPFERQPIDPHLYTRVQKLRQELALTNRDLAAMGHTKESATALLESLKSWCTANKGALDQHHIDEIRARAALREAIRQRNAGSANKHMVDSLPRLQEDLAMLYEQRKARLDALIAQLESGMNGSQVKAWQGARANAGLSDHYRYVPDLSDEHRQSLHRISTGRTERNSRGVAGANKLTFSQKQAAEANRVNGASRADSIRDAEAVVLPVPEILVNPTTKSIGR